MPLYDYLCDAHGLHEAAFPYPPPESDPCPRCGGGTVRQFPAPKIRTETSWNAMNWDVDRDILKGTVWADIPDETQAPKKTSVDLGSAVRKSAPAAL